MKKFIRKVSFFVAFCLLVAIIPSYFIDPYNVFHWDNIRNNGVEPNKNYIKTKYILNNKEKFNGYLFGSSRVGAMHTENIEGYDVYNMTYSVGLPQENLDTLKTLIDNDVNIDIVYLGLDSISYTFDPKEHYSEQLRCPYQKLDWQTFLEMYINPAMVLQSISTIAEKKEIPGYDSFYTYGWWADYDYALESAYDFDTAGIAIGTSNLIDSVVKNVEEMKALCDNHGIKLVVFTNPMYERTYYSSVAQNYYEFLRKLVEVTDYYNFSGINSIATNSECFIDTSHYNAYVGDLMIDIMNGKDPEEDLHRQGFGWIVTPDNIDQLIGVIG